MLQLKIIIDNMRAEQGSNAAGMSRISDNEQAKHPYFKSTILRWAHQDSNLGPTDYESAALTAEL